MGPSHREKRNSLFAENPLTCFGSSATTNTAPQRQGAELHYGSNVIYFVEKSLEFEYICFALQNYNYFQKKDILKVANFQKFSLRLPFWTEFAHK